MCVCVASCVTQILHSLSRRRTSERFSDNRKAADAMAMAWKGKHRKKKQQEGHCRRRRQTATIPTTGDTS